MKNFTHVIFNHGYDDEVQALYDEDGTLIMSGDCYHDKINSQIKGFTKCLKHLKIEHKIVKKKKKSKDPYEEL